MGNEIIELPPNPKVWKPHHKRSPLTEEHIKEIQKCMDDPIYFIRNYIWIENSRTGTITKFQLYEYQEKMINHIVNDCASILMIPRQCGKTTVASALILWYAIFNTNKTVGIASKDGAAALDIMARIKMMYEFLPEFLAPNVVTYNKKDIAFDTGVAIISKAVTPTTFRGATISFLYLDELAFVKESIAREFWTSIFPAITAGGIEGMKRRKAVITSTPQGSENLFADLWFASERSPETALFRHLQIHNNEIPGREPGSGFEEMILSSGTITREEYEQEYLCSFTSSSKPTLINATTLETLPSKDPIKTIDGVEYYVKDMKGRNILLSVDVSEGIGQDYSVIQGIDIHSMEQIFEFADNRMSLTELAEKIIELLVILDKNGATELFYCIEGNPIGQGVIHLLKNATHEILDKATMISDRGRGKYGILMTTKSKGFACATFKDLVERNVLTLNSKKLITELKFFVKSGNTFKAEKGKHDDLVMAMVVAMNALERIASFDEIVYDTMKQRIRTTIDIDGVIIEDDEGLEDFPIIA